MERESPEKKKTRLYNEAVAAIGDGEILKMSEESRGALRTVLKLHINREIDNETEARLEREAKTMANQEKDTLSKKLRKYEAAMFSRKREEKMEKELGRDYDEKKYIDFMEKQYGPKCKEVLIKSYHYRVFQYFIHQAEEIDDRISQLRQKYASDRNAAHNFCLDMKSIYKLLSEDIHDELILLSDREFTLKEIIEDLTRLGLKPRQLTSVSDFLKIDGIKLM